MKVRYAKNCGFHAAYQHVAESERKRMAQDPESVRKKRRRSADTAEDHVQVLQERDRPSFSPCVSGGSSTCALLGGDFEEGRLRWLDEQASLKRQLADAADDEERMKMIHLHLLLQGLPSGRFSERRRLPLTRA